MTGSIPISNTVTQGELPLATLLDLADTLLLYRDSASSNKDLQVTLDLLATFIREGMATLDSPVLTGGPQAPTVALEDNSTAIATTAFVQGLVSILSDAITQINQTLSFSGKIRAWRAGTDFFGPGSLNDVPYPANIVNYNGNLYLVLQDFTSGNSFSEKVNDVLVLSRLTMDSDPDVLELYVGSVAPFWNNQELGSYLALRPFSINRQHVIPNAAFGALMQVHLAKCNPTISDTNTVVLRRTNAADGSINDVATITFNGTPSAAAMPGVIAINDPLSVDPTNVINVLRNDMLTFVLTAKTNDLTWLRINMIGNFISFSSPSLNIGPM